ncbi:Ig domain-containing protein [Achromobacter xylosoxidans]|uniref:Ig domain-containing protein n=1 Tax=Alcaligenes xylosoxydans xylosoxydans TaxID=85698 RepID=UPI001F130338|nr:Ig domain-containing protein [Achromobacter xylosoxidans]
MTRSKGVFRFLKTLSKLALYVLTGAGFVLAVTGADLAFAQSRLSVISVVVQKVSVTPRLGFAQASVTLAVGDAVANPALSDLPASEGAITYRSSDDAIARVAADGTVTAAAAGTATITAMQAADPPAFEAGTGSYQVTVIGPLSAGAAIASQVWLVGEPVASVVPVIASGGVGKLRYAIAPALPPGLAFSADTGALSGAATVESPLKSYTVTVSDAATPSHTDSATFDLTIAPAFVASGGANTALFELNKYDLVEALVIVRGGVGAFNVSVTPPLPAGLKLSVAKDPASPVSVDYIVNIDGTPSVVSPLMVYTVTVTDSAELPHSYTSTFEVSVAGPLAATVTEGNRIAVVGEAISYRPITAAGGVPDLSVYDYAVSPALPAGLVMDQATGVIAGAASSVSPATAYTVTLTASPGSLPSATASFTLEIVDGLAATTLISTQTVVAGDPFNSTPVTAAGGVGAPHFAITPSLPAGLSMDTDTGAITGAAAGESKATVYTVTVTDDASNSATATFSLEVRAGLSTSVFNHSETHRVTDPVDYTPSITSGGVRPYQYTVTPALPAGLAMDAGTGAITGAATAPSALTAYTYTVTDSATPAHSTTGTFSLMIEPALTVTTVIPTMSLAPGATVTDAPVKAEGGLGLHHFSVQPALPAGLTMDELSGTIQNVPGTPIEPSPAREYTVTVTDSATPLQTATATFTLAVDDSIAVMLNMPNMFTPVNEPLTAYAPVTASGGIGSLSYDVAPPLPNGLTMDPATGVISGTPTVESLMLGSFYTVTITDGASPAHTVQKKFILVTYNRPTASVLEPSKVYMIGDTVSYVPVKGGGVGDRPLQYKMLHGGLPAGLTMNPYTGAVSGTALEVSPANTFAVGITDALFGEPPLPAYFDLEIAPALALHVVSDTVTGPATGDPDVALDSFLTVSGGVGDVTITSVLPSKLTFTRVGTGSRDPRSLRIQPSSAGGHVNGDDDRDGLGRAYGHQELHCHLALSG